MTTEFFTGNGPRDRLFYNDQVARALQYSRGANAARAYFYNKYKNTSDLTHATVTHFDAGFGIRGLISAGLNPIEQFVGNFKVNMWVDGTNLFFAVHNITSFQSLTYDLGPNWERSDHQRMGNTEQWYIWSEPINRPGYERY